MSQFYYEKKSTLKHVWQIGVMILLNLLIIAVILYPFCESETVQTLSKVGSRGDEVRSIQTKLRELGLYSGAVDGVYGSQTEKGVKAFQKQCGLSADGVCGPKTLQYLGLGGGSGGGSGSSGGSTSTGGYSQNDYNLLARVISAEARGEPYSGQVAVGSVVLNRVKHSSFPDSVAGVIYQPGAFSCLNDSNWSQPVSESAKKAARDALNGSDPSGGAVYYYNPAKTSNQWMRSRPVIKTIGSHLFCK